MAIAMNKLYASQVTAEINSRINFKGPSMSPQSDRDAGFCSGSSELGDDRCSDSPHSQIDTSEDSIDVKLPIISTKNKRKCSEPLKVIDTDLGPLKKRIRYNLTLDSDSKPAASKAPPNAAAQAPFRPWTVEPKQAAKPAALPVISSPAEIFVRHPGVTTLHRAYSPPVQEEPLALIKKKTDPTTTTEKPILPILPSIKVKPTSSLQEEKFTPPPPPPAPSAPVPSHEQSSSSGCSKSGQRNYKNMTRERRIEANARERSRVHTISAAYETLRNAIPSYSNSQKLSKLAVLKIACAYILTLSRMNGEDLSADGSEPNIQDCIDKVNEILQSEGKVKKEDDSE